MKGIEDLVQLKVLLIVYIKVVISKKIEEERERKLNELGI